MSARKTVEAPGLFMRVAVISEEVKKKPLTKVSKPDAAYYPVLQL